MKKLQQGDYVRNLTQQQWDFLLDIEGKSNWVRITRFHRNQMIYDNGLLLPASAELGEQLTYEEFKLRATRTFIPHGYESKTFLYEDDCPFCDNGKDLIVVGDQSHFEECHECEGRAYIMREINKLSVFDFIQEEVRKGNQEAINLISKK